MWGVLFLLAFPFVYFWKVTVGQSVWYTTDIIRLFHPFGLELERALNSGGLPLWSPGILGGFPLLAEGQVGALYPVNLLLFKFLPAHNALSYSILIHLAWAGCGMYAYVRSNRLRPPAALLAGFVFSFSSFVFGHLSQPAVIATLSWLPWLLYFHSQFRQTGLARWFLFTTAAFGIQFLCGSAQIAFLNSIAFAVFGLVGELILHHRSLAQVFTGFVLSALLPAFLGTGLAASQLLPTAELVSYSVRSESSVDFFSSYSLPPTYLLQYIFPSIEGEPSEPTGEFRTYLGLAPLLLALLAPWLRRDLWTKFLFVFAILGLALSIGKLNPAYQLLYQLPLFALFRVPARYLHLVVFALAVLAAMGFDQVIDRLGNLSASSKRMYAVIGAFSIAIIALMVLALSESLEFWLAAWQVLPVLLGVALFAIFLAVRAGMIRAHTLTVLIVGLTLFDLTAYFPLFLSTIDSLTSSPYVDSAPRSVSFLEATDSRERVYTDLSTFPSFPSLRNSLFPNIALTYGRESAQAYSSLAFARQETYVANPSPAMLNLLNVRYLMIPLEPRPLTKSSSPNSVFGLDVVDNEVMIPPTRANAIQISAFTEEASNLQKGTKVAQVTVRSADGQLLTFPLRVGIEVSDWDYDRKILSAADTLNRAQVARTFPGFLRSFGRMFDGHTYLTRLQFSTDVIIGLIVNRTGPGIQLGVESIRLQEENGGDSSLARLSKKNDFELSYMSDTVAVWENKNVIPRVFVVHSAELMDDGRAFERMRSDDFDPGQVVLLSEGETISEQIKTGISQGDAHITRYGPQNVTISVSTDRAGYLVFADSWYPGWSATVDGKSAPVYRADAIFRAVPIGQGDHTVEFQYQSVPFLVGIVIGIVCLCIAGACGFALYGKRRARLP